MTCFRIAVFVSTFMASGCFQILGFSEFEFGSEGTDTSTNGTETETAATRDISSDTAESDTLPPVETKTSSDTLQGSVTDTVADLDTQNSYDTSTMICTGCSIEGKCIPHGATNSLNRCQICNIGLSINSWTDNDGVRCDDGLFCTENTYCSSGVCEGTLLNCSDYVDCNGEEWCNEDSDKCAPGTTRCNEKEFCNVDNDECITDCMGCAIAESCYSDDSPHPSNTCLICDVERSATEWSPNNGATCNDGEFCNGADTCLAGTCTEHAGTPCTTSETCVEEEKICCNPDTCSSSTNCDENGDAVCINECEFQIVIEDCVSAANNGTCASGSCGCASGFTGTSCDQCLVTNGGIEMCDGIDNDCNGSTDEVFDFAIHPSHCGECGNDCYTTPSLWPDFNNQIPENMASAQCVASHCSVFECATGYSDDPLTPTVGDCDLYIRQVLGGRYHTCTLIMDRSVRCWGLNEFGQLGIPLANSGGYDSTPFPQTVSLSLPSDSRILRIAVGDGHGCALLSNNSVYCWGTNRFGQLGVTVNTGDNIPNPSPLKANISLTQTQNLVDISAGIYHTCAYFSDSTVQCWGMNYYGQLGSPDNLGTSTAHPSPNTVSVNASENNSVIDLATGFVHSCALLANGDIQCWGTNTNGALGSNLKFPSRFIKKA